MLYWPSVDTVSNVINNKKIFWFSDTVKEFKKKYYANQGCQSVTKASTLTRATLATTATSSKTKAKLKVFFFFFFQKGTASRRRHRCDSLPRKSVAGVTARPSPHPTYPSQFHPHIRSSRRPCNNNSSSSSRCRWRRSSRRPRSWPRSKRRFRAEACAGARLVMEFSKCYRTRYSHTLIIDALD